MPKVSVILSSYNQAKYLAAAIQSVLDQTFADFELLIFDDGSNDNSQEIIRSFDDARIRLFLYEKNRGAVPALKGVLGATTGEYIAIHHSDDVWEPTKLAEQIDFLDANSQYAACFTQVKFIDENGVLYDLPENHPYKRVFKKQNRSREEWLNTLFWNLNCFCNPSVLFRNEQRELSLNACLFQLPDYFMWLNLCKRENVYVLERELIQFRLRRKEQNSVSSLSLEKSIRSANETYFTAREFLSLTDDAAEFLKIFPEAEEYLIGEEIVPRFAFARLCLRHNLSAYQKLGMEILYDLLNDAATARNVKKLYNYDEKNFIRDTGAHDVFGIRFQMPVLHSRLYMDFGEGMNEHDSLESSTLIRPDGTFTVRFDCPTSSAVKALRFDPDDIGVILIKLDRVIVNGTPITDYKSNAQSVIDEYYLFTNTDPWFMIRCGFSDPELHVEISGVVDQNPLPKLEETYRTANEIIFAQSLTPKYVLFKILVKIKNWINSILS